jgi:fatty-acyl-CoA synthase
MHGTAGLTALSGMLFGGAVITLTQRSFDPDELWSTVASAGVTNIAVVGDVFCRPMVDALDRAAEAGNPYDISTLQEILSSGVMWSQPVKDRLLAHASAAGIALKCTDSLGASEGVGFASKSSLADGDTETATFELGPNAALFTADGHRIEPGSEESGLLAVSGPIPLGYYGDPEKTASTFREFEGVRWSIPGDWATLSADGMVTLLGRGSVSINTGGEKVFPEEVEEALKLLPEVADVNVVGVPDETWGAAVTAVVELVDGVEVDRDAIVDRLRGTLAGYKLPKHVVVVPALVRGPNGKSDYRWAASTARDSLGLG